MEHNRPEGLGQGYYCTNCGRSGVNMYASGHYNMTQRKWVCEKNAELVAELDRLNK